MNTNEKSFLDEYVSLKFSFDDIIPFILEKNSEGVEVLLKVNGNSMSPFLISQRDRVCFVSVDYHRIKCGDILLFRMPTGKYIMHRLYRINKDATYDFVGDHNFVLEKSITKDNIIAYVPYVIRKGKKIDCSTGYWRWGMVLYMKFRMACPRLVLGVLKVWRGVRYLTRLWR